MKMYGYNIFGMEPDFSKIGTQNALSDADYEGDTERRHNRDSDSDPDNL